MLTTVKNNDRKEKRNGASKSEEKLQKNTRKNLKEKQ
jgi:hypothetical protein